MHASPTNAGDGVRGNRPEGLEVRFDRGDVACGARVEDKRGIVQAVDRGATG